VASDAELAVRFERDALPLLDMLFIGALRMTRSRGDAEDLLQDTMMSAYARVRTFQALNGVSQGDTAAYIELVTDTYAAPPMAMKLHENIKTLYQS
jgi:DNA-directed RNA polymerase specialized sigma24 family protein